MVRVRVRVTNCDGSLRHVGRLLMFVAHVGENGVDTPVYIVHWRSTTDGKIATWIVALTPPLIPLRLITIS